MGPALGKSLLFAFATNSFGQLGAPPVDDPRRDVTATYKGRGDPSDAVSFRCTPGGR